MQKYNEELSKFNGADARRLPAAGAGEMAKRQKVAPPVRPVPQNRVFNDIFGRDLAGKIVSFHVETSPSLCDVLHSSLKPIGEESTDAILPKSQIFAEGLNGEFAMSDVDPISLKFPAQSMVDGQTEQYVNKFWVGQQTWYEFRFKQDRLGVLGARGARAAALGHITGDHGQPRHMARWQDSFEGPSRRLWHACRSMLRVRDRVKAQRSGVQTHHTKNEEFCRDRWRRS